jgi:hypothetical protein
LTGAQSSVTFATTMAATCGHSHYMGRSFAAEGLPQTNNSRV